MIFLVNKNGQKINELRIVFNQKAKNNVHPVSLHILAQDTSFIFLNEYFVLKANID